MKTGFLLGAGQLGYPSDSASKEGEEDIRASVKTKLACSASVGQSEKHSLHFQHSLEAISGMKLISRLGPLPTNPIAFFFLTSAQYLTHRPQRMQNEGSCSKWALFTPYS